MRTALINEISTVAAPEVLPQCRVGRSGRPFCTPRTARGSGRCTGKTRMKSTYLCKKQKVKRDRLNL